MKADELPEIIPPGTRVRLARSDSSKPGWQDCVGAIYTVGYYCDDCGLATIWLVNADGEYEQTVNRSCLVEYFDILEVSDETDYFGAERPSP